MAYAGAMTALAVGVALVLAAVQPSGEVDPTTIGSTRGARVAYAMGDERVELTFVAGPMPDERLDELRQVAPNVRVVSAATREEAMSLAGEAHGVDGRFYSPAFHEAAPNLVWVQSPSAGVAWLLDNESLVADEDVVLTNMRAVHGPAIADHAFAMLLTLTRSMRVHQDNQEQAQWDRRATDGQSIALEGRTMFVVGLGGIGSEIARRAKGFGMRVVATRRTEQPMPDYVDKQGLAGDFDAFLARADVVAICVPLTSETEGMFDADAFATMKPGAYLINIARGRIVKTDAMLEALRSGRLAGACLDVTDPEPLPAGHALWNEPNVVITPHIASDASLTDERRWVLLRENIRRFGAGEALLNTVDKDAGY